jgi:two-component system, cell cycle sensor histidine kinase and response regulator CckA
MPNMKTREQQKQFLETVRYLTESLDTREVLVRIATRAIQILDARNCAIYLLEPDHAALTPAIAIQPPGADPMVADAIQVDSNYTRQAMDARRGLIFNQPAPNGPVAVPDNLRPPTSLAEAERVLAAPFLAEGEVLGALCLYRIGDCFTEDDLTLAETLAAYAATTLKNARAHFELQREVEERRRAEAALRQSEEKLRLIFEHAFDGISIYEELPETRSRRLLDCNERYTEIAGRSKQELMEIGNTSRVQIKLEGPATREENRHIRQNQISYTGRFAWRRPDGKENIIEYSAAPIQVGDQALTIGIDRDITDRVAAEEALRHRAAELEALARVSAAFNLAAGMEDMLSILLRQAMHVVGAAYGAVFLVDGAAGDMVCRAVYPLGAFSMVGVRHPMDKGITGYVASSGEAHISPDLARDPLVHLLPAEVAYARTVGSSISLPLRTQESIIGVINIALRERRPFAAGEQRLLTATADMAANALQRARVVDNLEAEVAARTRQIREEQETREEMYRELDQARRQFLNHVSHELRTPVTNVKLFAHLLQQTADRQKAQVYLGQLEQEADRLVDLIQDTLEVTELDSVQVLTAGESVPLAGAVADVVTRYHDSATAKNLTLRSHLAPDSRLQARSNRHWLAQALDQLVRNAVQYTPAGGHITVDGRTVEDAGRTWVTVAVHDSGPGIASHEQERIFERFYRGSLAESGHMPGTGLGLSIVREIMRVHGGRITVQSQPGMGSTFTLWLPPG